MAPIQIKLSKGKLLSFSLLALIFVALGIWLFLKPVDSNQLITNPYIIKAVGILSIAVFGFMGIFIIRKMGDNSPGLLINDEGLTINTNGFGSDKVLWSDITGFKELTVSGQKLLTVVVKNPDDYINKHRNPLVKKAMTANYNLYGSPISITANSLQINFNALNTLLVDKLEEVKKMA